MSNYKFNPFSQSSSLEGAAAGAGLSGAQAEQPKAFFDFKTTTPKKSGPSAPSGLPEGARYPVPNTTSYKKFMELQTKFTTPDGKLVWQKMPMDKPLYFFVVGGVVAATTWSFYYLHKMASPPKNQ